MTFKIIEFSSPEWNKYINSSVEYDFHHTSCFHAIEKKENEAAFLAVAQHTNDFIALPIITKKIPNTDYLDATSVYGYAGPTASQHIEELPQQIIRFFHEKFIEYCHENKIITVFARLHPIIEQTVFFQDFGKVIKLNKTVAIDLKLPIDEQRRSFRKSTKSEINQLKKKKGYSVKKINANNDSEIKEFVEIYHETMQKVAANEYYFFDFNYFKKLLTNDCFECDLLVAMKDEKMTAGAIFTKTKTIMQYHLAGTREAYAYDTPMKLIIDQARLLGTEEGLEFLHLGGGVGGSDEDSLFRFKAGFSKNFFQFSVWNLVVNPKVYNMLVKEKQVVASNHPNFFPLYRAK